MKKLLLLFLLPLLSIAQEGAESCAKSKKIAFTKARLAAQNFYPGDNTIDVTFHKIDLSINHVNRNVKGSVTTNFKPLSAINTVFFNLKNALKVDSVVYLNQKISFSHTNDKVNINFPNMLEKDKVAVIVIYYGGIPPSTAFGSFSTSTHGTDKSPVVWSLSEPYGAPDWWPCKDDLKDKVDSSVVSITMDSFFTTVSNGVLISEKTNTSSGTKTFTWKNKYPIAHYLISIASSNYGVYEQSFDWAGIKMPVTHYVYPEILNAATKVNLDRTLPMLKFFSETYGEYPFLKEKYGHAQCNFGGGMEHQTVSSMGGFGESLVAHELAHQWFGDKITCKTWSDIFVNEAFASYSEALWRENKNGKADYNTAIQVYMNAAKRTTVPIFITNPENENAIFNYDLTYAKGAAVIHMLRGVLGDADFFKSLKAYMASQYAYGPATILDFKAIVEKTSGKDLNVFFEQWIRGTNYPRYAYSWGKTGDKEISISINQDKLNTSPALFNMPIQFTAKFNGGLDSTFTVILDAEKAEFKIKNLKSIPTELIFDPNNYILKNLEFIGRIDKQAETTLANPVKESENLIFPNPVSANLRLSNSVNAYEIRDSQGKVVLKQNNKTENINVNNLSSGVYFLLTEEDGKKKTIKFIKN